MCVCIQMRVKNKAVLTDIAYYISKVIKQQFKCIGAYLNMEKNGMFKKRKKEKKVKREY